MKKFKKSMTLIIINIIVIVISSVQNSVYTSANVTFSNPVKIGVFLYKFDDLYMSLLKQNLEDIQKENENRV